MSLQYVLLVLSLFQHGAGVLSTRAEPGTENACPAKRSMYEIVWSCVSTTIICAWVSVHPNVPPSGYWKGLWRRVKMMIWTIIAPELILAWAVRQWFAAWEIRDAVNGLDEGWLTGPKQTIQGWFRQGTSPVLNKWTMAHGHLVAMGGISTIDPSVEDDGQVDPRGPVLTIERYTKTEDKGRLDRKLRKISEEDIKDRSKGDILSKLIAITQTTWFILQCIARGQQRLTLTELELVTLALASLNAITYVFWWHKPLGVQVPIRIYFETKAVERVDVEDANIEQGITASYVLSKFGSLVVNNLNENWGALRRVWNAGFYFIALFLFLIISPITLILFVLFFEPLPFALGIVFLLNILKTRPVAQQELDGSKLIAAQIILALRQLRYKFTTFIARSSEKWLRKFLDDNDSSSGFYIGWLLVLPTLFVFLLVTTIILLPLFTLLFLISFIFTAVFGIITSSTVTPNSLHVPSFYAPTTKSDKYSRMVVFALFGVIFGGLHCIGWNFSFPTAFEQHLWRSSSLAITVIPLIVAPIDYLLENYDLDKGFLKVLRLTLDLIMTILLFTYVPARLTLIGQAFALLRKQPQDAFLAVDWKRYIPHLF